MADTAAKRELRRKRILENSESRLQRITGRVKEKSKEEKSNDDALDKTSGSENGFAKIDHLLLVQNKAIADEKHKDTLNRENSLDFHDSEVSQFDSLCQESDNNLTTNRSNLRYSLKEDSQDYELNLNLKNNSDRASLEEAERSLIHHIFYSPYASILLAVFVNILTLVNVDFTLYKGILTPYFILALTRLCLGINCAESQTSDMLMAALILCNIKPEIVRTFKKIVSFYKTTIRDYAIYLTSFVLMNWIISLCRNDLSLLQFF